MTTIILLIVALSTHGRSHEMPYEVCDAFIDDAVRYSQMDKMHLKTLRSQVMNGRPVSELWSTYYLACREKLL